MLSVVQTENLGGELKSTIYVPSSKSQAALVEVNR